MKLYWIARSKKDLFAIARFIARDNREAARLWAAKLKKRAKLAAGNPWAGRAVPELGRRDIREVLMKNYRIVYSVGRGRIDILTVFEAHRPL